MGEMEELRKRIEALEERMDVIIDLINDFIEMIYEPEYVKKLDKLARYGKKEASEQG
jgi:t-SNARE complex subunit (syntaxin)